MFLGDDFAIQLLQIALFLLQHLVAPCLKSAKALVEPFGAAPVNPHSGLGEVFEKTPVMADENEGRAQAAEFLLQPFDRGQIEMVGGLVEQQHVRLGRQHAGQRRAPRLAARQIGGVFLARQPQLFEQHDRLVGIVERPKARLGIGERGLKAR